MDVESLAKQLILKGMTEEQQNAVLESIKTTMGNARTVQKQRIGENVQVVVQALKKIEADIKSRYDETGKAIEKRVASIKDGRDGRDGVDGRAGKDGRPGRDGAVGPRGIDGLNGSNGVDGVDGISITDAHIDFDGSLIITLSDGKLLNVGEVVSQDIAEKIKVIQTMSTNGAVGIKDEGTSISTGVKNINFVGATVTATNSGDDVTVNVSAGTGTVTSVAVSGGTTGLTTSGGPITTTGTITLGGTLAVASGGTGTATPSLVAGTNITSITGSWPNQTINASGGSGTVTSVAATVPAFLSVTGSPITTSGTLAIGLSGTALPVVNGGTGVTTSTGTTNVVLSNSPTLVTPNLGTPSALVGTNITGTATAFTASNVTTNANLTGDVTSVGNASTLATVNSNVGAFTNANITVNAKGLITAAASGSPGGVTSVTGTSPVASSGGTTPAISLASGYGDTLNPYASKTANFVLAAPNGTAGVPTFRAVVAADIPTLNQSTTGSAATLTTGRTIAITGDLAYTSPSFNGSTNVTAAGTLATVNANVGSFTAANITVNAKGLITAASNGTAGGTVTSVAATVPAFLSVSGSPITTSGTLAIGLSGTALPIANGGTAATSASAARTSLGLAIGTDVLAPNGSAASLTSFPTLNQNTTGSAATVTGNATGSTFGFNSGYGSVATAYGCRAWVNFNGTGTVAIRASGNVSSITDNGTGDYTVSFSTAMPDGNYSVVAGANGRGTDTTPDVGVTVGVGATTTSGSVATGTRIAIGNPSSSEDCAVVTVAIFR